LGIVTTDGVILFAEKRPPSKLSISDSVEKLFEIERHIGFAVSGLVADSKVLVDFARSECQNHWFTFDELMPVKALAGSVCDLSLRFGEDGSKDSLVMSRPFGTALLIGGFDSFGYHLFYADPSGTFTRYEARAIGSGSEVAQTALEEKYSTSLDFNQGLSLGLEVLKSVMEEKLTKDAITIATLRASEGFRMLPADLIGQQLASLGR
jgi:20S proteasome subunit alpha 5